MRNHLPFPSQSVPSAETALTPSDTTHETPLKKNHYNEVSFTTTLKQTMDY